MVELLYPKDFVKDRKQTISLCGKANSSHTNLQNHFFLTLLKVYTWENGKTFKCRQKCKGQTGRIKEKIKPWGWHSSPWPGTIHNSSEKHWSKNCAFTFISEHVCNWLIIWNFKGNQISSRFYSRWFHLSQANLFLFRSCIWDPHGISYITNTYPNLCLLWSNHSITRQDGSHETDLSVSISIQEEMVRGCLMADIWRKDQFQRHLRLTSGGHR